MQAKKFTTYTETINGYSFKMIAVQGGTFDMGDEYGDLPKASRPIRRNVKTSNFHLAEFPVTNQLWQTVMDVNEASSRFKGKNHPVERVSRNDVCKSDGFLDRLNRLPQVAARNASDGMKYRLPTEAQWEYAARGGIHKSNHSLKYAGSNKLKEVGWSHTNGNRSSMPVGLKLPNALGLCDMSGNVFEWCEDRWHDSYDAAPLDGKAWLEDGDENLRVIRGGSWDFNDDFCRVSIRFRFNADFRDVYIGFRVSRY